MSKMDDLDFKFPDEKDGNVAISEEDKFEIEIEDDTPEEDRGRQPLPKEITEKLDKDELAQYDDEVKQKLLQMKKAWHDERREKERVMREQDEAVAYAKRLMEENQKIRGAFNKEGKQHASAVQKSAEKELEIAQRKYKDAYESGDVEKITKATMRLSEANFKLHEAKNVKFTPLQEQEVHVKINTEPERVNIPRPDEKATAWQQRNSWFGADAEMTASALGLHEKLRQSGMEIGSDQYYATLDKTMRKRFPEHFGETSQSEERAEVQTRRAPSVVAPAVRSTASNKVKLSTRQVMLAKKLGLTNEQYAIEMKRLEK